MIESKSDRFWLVMIVIAALAVRLWMLFCVIPAGDQGMSLIGEARYLYNGLGYSLGIWTADGYMRVPSVYDMPGYAILLAGSWKIFGTANEFLPLQVFQVFVDSFFCLLVYSIGRDVFGRKIGLLAALLFAFYLPEANFAAMARRDVWATWGVLGAAWLFLKYQKNGSPCWMAVLGFVVGLTCYFKATLLLLPFAFAVTIPHGLLRTVRDTALAMFVAFLCLLPWAIRNHNAYGRWIFTRCTLAQNTWVGFGEVPNPVGAVASEEVTLRQMQAEGFKGTSNSTLDFEDFIKPKVEAAIRDHRLWYWGLVLKRIPMALIANRIPWGVFQDQNVTYHKMFEHNTNQKSMLRYTYFMAKNNPGFLFTKLLDLLLLLAAICGLYLRRNDWKKWGFLATIPAYFIAVHIPIHIEGRYMVPAHGVFILFAAAALAAMLFRRSDNGSNPQNV